MVLVLVEYGYGTVLVCLFRMAVIWFWYGFGVVLLLCWNGFIWFGYCYGTGLVRCWYCFVIVLGWCSYSLGMVLVLFSNCVGIDFISFWYCSGMFFGMAPALFWYDCRFHSLTRLLKSSCRCLLQTLPTDECLTFSTS